MTRLARNTMRITVPVAYRNRSIRSNANQPIILPRGAEHPGYADEPSPRLRTVPRQRLVLTRR